MPKKRKRIRSLVVVAVVSAMLLPLPMAQVLGSGSLYWLGLSWPTFEEVPRASQSYVEGM